MIEFGSKNDEEKVSYLAKQFIKVPFSHAHDWEDERMDIIALWRSNSWPIVQLIARNAIFCWQRTIGENSDGNNFLPNLHQQRFFLFDAWREKPLWCPAANKTRCCAQGQMLIRSGKLLKKVMWLIKPMNSINYSDWSLIILVWSTEILFATSYYLFMNPCLQTFFFLILNFVAIFLWLRRLRKMMLFSSRRVLPSDAPTSSPFKRLSLNARSLCNIQGCGIG